MDAKTQRKVLDLFDEGKLPQQIVDQLGIPMLEVVRALKVRLRIDDGAVEQAANDEIRKQRAVQSISDRLRVVDGATPAVPAPAAAADQPAPTIEARSAESAAIQDLSDHVLVDLVRTSLAGLEPGLTPIEGDHPADGRDPGPCRIFACDATGAPVFIEVVARATTSDPLVRLLAAMGAPRADAAHQVRGILIANYFSDEIRHAAETVPTLELRTYRVTLSFAEV